MGDQADNVEDIFKIPTTPEGWAAGLVGGPAGLVYGNMKEDKKKEDEEEHAAADAKAKAEADAKATADAKAAAEAAATEEARRLAELRLARRSRAMTTDSDTTDSARLRLG